MSTAELENRLGAIEQEIALLKASVVIPPTNPNQWIENIAGTFSSPEDKAAFDEAMRYGRQWRKAQFEKPRKARRSARQ